MHSGRAQATPRPVDQSDARRVLEDVARGGLEVFVVSNHSSLEPVLEQVADSAVALVEPHRIDAVEPVHPGREVRLGRLHEHVDVVVEQAPRMDHPAEALLDVEEQSEPAGAVLVVVDDRPLLDPTADTVVVGRARQV